MQEHDEGTVPEENARDLMADLEHALSELNAAAPEYAKAQEYYDGEAPEKFASTDISKILHNSMKSDDFYVNLAGRTVTAVLDRMEITSVTAEDPDLVDADDIGTDTDSEPTDEESDDLTEILNDLVWHRNELDIEAPEIHEKTLSLGDSCLFVWESEDDDGVDIFYKSPFNTRVIYELEKPRTKKLAIDRWEEDTVDSTGTPVTRVNLHYPEGTYKFITKQGKSGRSAHDYETYIDEYTNDEGFVDNPWGVIPVFHFRTARPYGRPEHKKAYGAQDAITKLIKNQMSLSDFAAFPQRYGLIDDSQDGTDDPDDFGSDDSSPADRPSQFVSGPGQLWLINKIKELGEFTAADVDQILKPLSFYIGALSSVTGTPLSYFAQPQGMRNTRESGESQRQEKDPLIKKTEARLRSFTATWRETLQFAMQIMGYKALVNLSWAPLELARDVDGWRAVQEQQRAGVPVRQALMEAGYTVDQVDEWGYTEENPDGGSAEPQEPEQPPLLFDEEEGEE